MNNSRRRFLKQSVGAVAGAGVSIELAGQRGKQPLNTATLQAVAEIVLPAGELSKEGIAKAISGFQSWMDGFEPVAELNHPYLSSSEIQYGPPDPRPRWQSQLEGLELESQKKYAMAFAQLGIRERRQMIERAIRDDRLDRLPPTAEAHHAAVALAAHFYASADATDLCYNAAIQRWGCHGLEAGAVKPAEKRS